MALNIARAVTKAVGRPNAGPVSGGSASVAVSAITSSNTASNVENTTLVKQLTANAPVTWSISGGVDAARFEIAGSVLRWLSNGTKDYETPNDSDTNNTYVVQVKATDALSGFVTQNITVTVTDADEVAPTITSSASPSVAENAVLAHALTANEAVTWAIIGGADQARFELSGSTLRWLSNGTKDYEIPNDADTNNAYVVQVRATDTAGNTTNQTITVTVTDVTETGFAITSGATGNSAENTALASALTANASASWAIVGGADAAKFELSGNILRWASNGTKNYEAPDDSDTNNTYQVTVRATKLGAAVSPAYQSIAKLAYGTGRTSSTVAAPSGIVDGDTLIAEIHTGNSGTSPVSVTAPSGFSLESTSTTVDGSFTVCNRVYRKRASSESGSYVFTHATAETEIILTRISDVDPTTALDVAVATQQWASGQGLTTAWPSITTVTDGCLIMWFESAWDGLGSGVISGTTPSGVVRSSPSTVAYAATGLQSTAGAIGTRTRANGNGGASSHWASAVMALRPTPGSGGGGETVDQAITITVTDVDESFVMPTTLNTGDLSGVTRTDYAGPWTITTPNIVLEHLNFVGNTDTLTISAANVTIRNCYFDPNTYFGVDFGSSTGGLIEDCTMDGRHCSPNSFGILLGPGGIARRNNLYYWGNGIGPSSDSLVSRNCIALCGPVDASAGAGEAHIDGIQFGAGANWTIEGNFIESWDTGGITMITDYGNISGGTINNNWLRNRAGQTTAGALVVTNRNGFSVTGIICTNNIIEAGYNGNVSYSTADATAFAVWSGNKRYSDNAAIPSP